ncbi:DNA repair protein RecO [Alkalinema sp. FACHB-956]|uniref:DNA repair protein RecO n=1 Tax=Alkalinema sp. FACHB-956 TaxID=2692768 RepID=UPI0016890E66|nr:DNA repair protein RecO [Alkalinema sp. FACHB-956]MBD2328518.1 DNA repair protein RecO [Alkalinema sp. FACHB-956]
MSRTYKVTGINLKSKPIGEADRILTILTKEQGLLRVIAPGARKQKSRLSGRSALFVVNDLLIAKGKSMDKVLQAESIESFPKLALDIKKLTAGQYLVELALQQAVIDLVQEGLFYLLIEHLSRVEQAATPEILPCLTHGIFQLLAYAGIAPQMHQCCLSGDPVQPELDNPNWRVAFSIEAGGAVTLAALNQFEAEQQRANVDPEDEQIILSESSCGLVRVAERPAQIYSTKRVIRPLQLGSTQVTVMQQLAETLCPVIDPDRLPRGMSTDMAWLSIERLLRRCTAYHFDRSIRSAKLIDRLFGAADSSSP